MKQVIYEKSKFVNIKADLDDKSVFTKIDNNIEGYTCGTQGMYIEEEYIINEFPSLYLNVHKYAVDEVHYYLMVHGVTVYCSDLYGVYNAIRDYKTYMEN